MLRRSTTLTTCFVTVGLVVYTAMLPAQADQQTVALAPGFSPDPQVVAGTSGGIRETSDCGYLKAVDTPDYVLTLTAPFTFLRASVQAEGDVTMMIEGPNGRICSDDVNGLMPEISGPAPAGIYKVWIGDYVGDPDRGFEYELVLSEETTEQE